MNNQINSDIIIYKDINGEIKLWCITWKWYRVAESEADGIAFW